MRKALRKAGTAERFRFVARVERFGSRTNWNGFPEPTVLLRDVRFAAGNALAADHVWFAVGKTIERLNLRPGMRVEFDARVGEYVKGYVNWRHGIDERTTDYKLNRPTRWSVLGFPPRECGASESAGRGAGLSRSSSPPLPA